jgi:hypothetical protein
MPVVMAKSGTVKGDVINRGSGKAVPGVAILAKDKDNNLLGYTFTNEKGDYVLGGIPFKQDFRLFASLYGLLSDSTTVLRINLPFSSVIKKNWELSEDPAVLKEVLIKGYKPTFVIRNDTLEFDATAFKLLPHAVLEDLLRRLPGVIIARDGSITVNGNKATKIQVDGRDFFGNNLSIATQNIPAEIVDKIQVTPTDDPAKRFNKTIKPLSGDVTINVQLKKDKSKGLLGKLAGGLGTQDRYTGNAFLSTLGGQERYGIYGSAGNGNSSSGQSSGTGSSLMSAISGGKGGTLTAAGNSPMFNNSGATGPAGGSPGLNDQKNLSGNFNTLLGKHVKVDGNYNFDYQQNTRIKATERQNLLESGNLLYDENQSSINNSTKHSFSSTIDYTPDTLSQWRFMPTLSYSPYNMQERTLASGKTADDRNLNSSAISLQSDGSRRGFGNQFFWGRRSSDGKNALTVNWNLNEYETAEEQRNTSENKYINSGGGILQTSTDQHGSSTTKDFTNQLSVQFSRMIGNSFTGVLVYSLDQQVNRIKRAVYNYNVQNDLYDLPDSSQSGDTKRVHTEHLAYFQLTYRRKQLNIALNTGLRWIKEDNHLFREDSRIRSSQLQYAPSLIANYSLSSYSKLSLNYDISSNAPTAEQLSPITDSKNPLVIITGNPDLKTAIGHHINLGFSDLIPENETSIHMNGGANITSNQIIQDISYDSQGRQIQSYRNADGYRSLYFTSDIQRGFHIDEWSIRPSVNLSFNHQQEVGYINSVKSDTKQDQFSGNTGIAINYREFITASASANLSFNNASYSLNNREGLNYNTRNYILLIKASPASRVEFGGQLSYQCNSQMPAGFQRGSTTLNTSFTYRFLKKEQLSAKIYINDVLNNAVANSTITAPSFIENTSVNTLKRYLLFSLQYNFSSLKGGVAHGK